MTSSVQWPPTLTLSGLPDRDGQLAILELHRRGTGDVGDVERVERLAAEIEPGFREQVIGEPRVQLLVLHVPSVAYNFASPSPT
jgi:hypothetical protein